MNGATSALISKLSQNPTVSDNEWSVHYVNHIVSSGEFWQAVAAGKPPECATIIARFGRFVKLARHGCWLWTGSRTGSWKGGQHGQFALRHDHHIYAHRLSYLLFNGPIPDDLLVRHTCDVGYCVRPSHLVVGTQKDNLQDAVERQRLPKFRAFRKMSPDQVVAMRRERMAGALLADLAARYNVTTANASLVCSGARRQHLAPHARGEKRQAS